MKSTRSFNATHARAAALALAVALATSGALAPAALAAGQTESAYEKATTEAATHNATPGKEAAAYEKTEIIYATLADGGALEHSYIVNKFAVSQAGAITDYGSYAAVSPMTSNVALIQSGNAVSFEAEEGTFYYQGTAMNPTLPWDFSLSYELDGRSVSADELAGATGTVKIHLTSTKSDAVDEAFAASYMMQITFTLPGSCTNIEADGATVAAAGENQTVVFTVLPGKDADCTLSMQVKDFAMAGAQIAALPYSSVIDMPDTDGMVNEMSQLTSAIEQLNSGAAELGQGMEELASGAGGLSSGAAQLASGSAAFADGLNAVSASSNSLVSGSEAIKNALDTIAAQLSGTSMELPDAATLEQLAGALQNLAEATSNAAATYGAAWTNVGTAINSMGAATGELSADEVSAMESNAHTIINDPTSTEAEKSVAQTSLKLASVYRAAIEVQTTYANQQTNVEAANAQLIEASENIAAAIEGLGITADALEEALEQLSQLPQLINGMSQLAEQYGQFHSGLVQYTDGVGALASNYAVLNSGIGTYAGGVGQFTSGANQLASGTSTYVSGMAQLNEATITLPDTMREQIDEMMADYDFPEFEARSFASTENAHTQAVQFVVTTAAIEKPAATEEESEEEPEPTMWDRLLALFGL